MEFFDSYIPFRSVSFRFFFHFRIKTKSTKMANPNIEVKYTKVSSIRLKYFHKQVNQISARDCFVCFQGTSQVHKERE